ncbi:MAG TPA: penicillin-binding transpeptidase domain-containing protein [Anaerolineales bacterium]|nr:penicillin-binding transpeptidase domain-containing protein [Anaerolineales bacterium]
MKYFYSLILSVLIISLAACNGGANPATPTTQVLPTLSQPSINTTQSPDVNKTVRKYLDAWENEDYVQMYGMLTSISKDAITEEQFVELFREVAGEAAQSSLETQILSALTQTRSAQASYLVTMHSALVGEIQRDTMMILNLEDGEWRIQWDEGLILPELSGGNSLRMDYLIPSRANIYDLEGQALVAQADATALGLFPDQIDPDQENTLLSELYRLTGVYPDTIAARYEDFPPGADWYLPLMAVSADAVSQRESVLSGLSGLVMRPFRSRYYFDGGISPHVVGYVSAIQAEEVEEYRRLGYRQDERVGQAGLERWGEEFLSGVRGGALYVVDPDGLTVTKLSETSPQASQAIYTTLDKDLQLGVQKAIDGYRGAAVVMELDTGRVLAMASSPGFDPNLFEPSNLNSGYSLGDLFDPDETPLLNRATQGQYPLGSVFKIITMAAALESGLYTPETVYTCGHTFTELQGVTLYDWTYEKELAPSGDLTLSEGLMRSCNPYFYHIGNDLYEHGLADAIPEMARGFGLGEITGIDQVEEEDGQVPDQQSPLDATNQSTGQGALQVTPLQVANFIAAIANGGTLYRPQIIESIQPPDGDASFTFEPEVRSSLPITEDTLIAIQEAMISVVENPRGTAHRVFSNFPIAVAGKTGTAQDPPRNPHAWFAGYTYANREGKPDIAFVVMLENAGEGSEIAAPIARGILQQYFFDKRDPFQWEILPGVWKTPTPEVTETPEP